ncbi:hypothetical protein FNV43_RR16760 [Rhamnella rubrinervis]|uniref:Uncharacterized protein n=1 Tax=Rhamnella rubrinervis TaxID=2594499 RepID=A0A8K0GZD3_9ROSA|nr:hypothetical protein FNV43_RR16760 [Rhamnella rubrinervis]
MGQLVGSLLRRLRKRCDSPVEELVAEASSEPVREPVEEPMAKPSPKRLRVGAILLLLQRRVAGYWITIAVPSPEGRHFYINTQRLEQFQIGHRYEVYHWYMDRYRKDFGEQQAMAMQLVA